MNRNFENMKQLSASAKQISVKYSTKYLLWRNYYQLKYTKKLELKLVILFHLFCCSNLQVSAFDSRSSQQNAEEIKVTDVTATTGSTVILPCRLDPLNPGDRPKVVLWYRKSSTKSIVSYDGRTPRISLPAPRLSNPHLSVTRASASLALPNVNLTSEDVYECRVDFFGRSPAHVSHVNLHVVESPLSIRLVDETEDEGPVVGPYPEGSKHTFNCLVKGGYPPPSVKWFRDGRKLLTEDVPQLEKKSVLRSSMRVKVMDRTWDNSNLTCVALNSNLTLPITATATLRMYLSASSVVVQGPVNTVEGRVARLQCWARGSKPPASLIWAINGETLHPDREESSITEGVSTSVVEVKVRREDDGAKVSCSAHNSALKMKQPPTNFTTLVVYYPPNVRVEFGPNLKPDGLREGVDVYLRCKVSANPYPDTILWFHDGREQSPNKSRGIIMSRDTLVLQKVDRHMAGLYSCSASNHLANATSKPLALKLAYKPVCLYTTTTTYYIYDQPINVTCHVASHPPATKIDWYWNSGNDIISLQPTSSVPEMMSKTPPTAAHWDRSWARLSVRPSKHQEDRQLSCWANNAMGRQEAPCRFFIRIAKTPAQLSSCVIANITSTSMSLTCDAPSHKHLNNTQYIVEIYQEDGTFMSNLTSSEPWFNVNHLDPGTAYEMKVYVVYGPVTSNPILVQAFTSNTPVQQPSRPTHTQSYRMHGTLAMSVLAVGLLVIISIIVVTRRSASRMPLKRSLGERPAETTQMEKSGEFQNISEFSYESNDDAQSNMSKFQDGDDAKIVSDSFGESFPLKASKSFQIPGPTNSPERKDLQKIDDMDPPLFMSHMKVNDSVDISPYFETYGGIRDSLLSSSSKDVSPSHSGTR